MENIPGKKRGYLNEDFRIFHLKDNRAQQVEYHYHEFDKLVMLLSGTVTYYIEGTPYELHPGDMLFVPHGRIHKPEISPSEQYERYVIWTTPGFLSRNSQGEEPLSLCFDRAGSVEGYIRRTDLNTRLELLRQLDAIRRAGLSDQFMAKQMADNLFICFMINVCRIFLSRSDSAPAPAPDPKISSIMEYIGRNLSGDLSVDALSSAFYISRYHLMRRFKAQSGYTLHQYITRRRILYAASLIGSGASVSEAAEKCGYDDYSAFLRAFKSIFKVSPRSFSSLGSRAEIYNE